MMSTTWAYIHFLKPLAILVAIGVVLLIARAGFMSSLPWMTQHYKVVTTIVNGIIETMNAIGIVVQVIVDAIKIVMFSLTGGKHPKEITVGFSVMHTVSYGEVHRALGGLGVACHKRNTGPIVIKGIFRTLLSDSVCPYIRALQPTGLGGGSHTLTSWMTYGVDPNPSGGVMSCTLDADPLYDNICLGIGSGFFVLELIVPAIIVIIALYEGKKAFN